MSDSLVYDMSQMSEGSPQVFVKRDWLSLLDQQNGNYLGNQSVIDTSQLSNSNKYMAYREGYLAVPLTLAVQGQPVDANNQTLLTAQPNLGVANQPAPGTAFPNTKLATGAVGLKNWFGHLVHSMTLDYAGTTIIQNTPLTSIWTHFGLMTTLSMGDVLANGATIGFYPDNATSFGLNLTNTQATQPPGIPNYPGVCNTYSMLNITSIPNMDMPLGQANEGMLRRSNYWSFSNTATAGGFQNLVATPGTDPQTFEYVTYGQAYSAAISSAAMEQLRLSMIVKNQAPGPYGPGGAQIGGYLQYGILAIIRLKDLHPFFSQVPLLKGVFMRLTLNLNQPNFTLSQRQWAAQASPATNPSFDMVSVTSPLGGVNPILIQPQSRMLTGLVEPGNEHVSSVSGCENFLYNGQFTGGAFGQGSNLMTVTLNVGNTPSDPSILSSNRATASNLDQSIMLYVPAYTFNPTFEEAYLGSPVKTVVYTDIYQYTTPAVTANGTFNQLLTNGIANIKSVLVFPVYENMVSKDYSYTGPYPGAPQSIAKTTSPLLSPFDTCPSTTSPLCHIANFNVVVAGQNMIYNTQKYAYEEFINQLSGCNSINANLVNGLTSGLIGQSDFVASQCLYYVNTSRMLPVDEVVPKSVSIQGQNMSTQSVRYICFIEYGVQVSVDVLTGSRV